MLLIQTCVHNMLQTSEVDRLCVIISGVPLFLFKLCVFFLCSRILEILHQRRSNLFLSNPLEVLHARVVLALFVCVCVRVWWLLLHVPILVSVYIL